MSLFRQKTYLNAFKTVSQSLFLGVAAIALTALPTKSAERIQFFYGPFEPTIYVDDIATFAETGEVAPSLEILADRLDSEQRERVRLFLNAQYNIDAVSISQFAYSDLGERLLNSLGEIIQTENFLNGGKAIRAALISVAAVYEGEATVMQIIQSYPLDTIQIDMSRLQVLLAESERTFDYRESIISEVKKISRDQSIWEVESAMGVDPQQTGRYDWQVKTIRFQSPNRSISSLADVYYPTVLERAPEDVPVITISHGVASNREPLAYLARHFVSHGYGVVVPEHIGTDTNKFRRFLNGGEGSPNPEEFILRPQDITAVLDALEAEQVRDRNLMYWDLASVGVLGHSLGGYTALSVGGASLNQNPLSESCTELSNWIPINPSMLIQCEISDLSNEAITVTADSRIKAVVALNPLASHILGESGLEQIDIPVMIVAGENDAFTPAVPEQIEPFNWLTTEEKTLVLIEQGTHFSLLDGSTPGVLPIPQNTIGPTPQQAQPQMKALSLSFFNQHLKDWPEAEIFLSQAYLSQFPTEPFAFNIISPDQIN
ncbi:MAG: alpha/beta hydrolase [Cyanobacteria bacterium J06588_5]